MPSSYLPASLTPADREKQLRSIQLGLPRPKVKSFRSQRSQYVVKFEQRYGTTIMDDRFIANHILRREGIRQILAKGRGAYFSSGSRPNQTPDSWARARLASVIVGGPARRVDRKIWEQYAI